MMLRDTYRRAFSLYEAASEGAGMASTWSRWPRSPTFEDLDRSPVTLGRAGGQIVAYFDADSVGGHEWADFNQEVIMATRAALAAVKNLMEFSRETGVQYSTLWRAKDGEAVPESVIDLMGKVPHVVLLGPAGPIQGDSVSLTRDQAVGLWKRPIKPETWYGEQEPT